MAQPDARIRTRTLVVTILGASSGLLLAAGPTRVPVLGQIALPHNYYYRELYLPQLTSGPSSVAWSPDGAALIYSMQGSLWRQRTDSPVAEQLTDEDGSDYQPDVSPDGRSVAFVRYDGQSMELMQLDLASRVVHALTTDGAVNVEPRWSPTGDRLAFVSTARTGHFLLHVADMRDGRIVASRPLTPDRRSVVARYYYSPFDHAINPTWTRDGKALVFVSNREIAHGTGDIVRLPVTARTRRKCFVTRKRRGTPDLTSRLTARVSSTAVTSAGSGSSSGCCQSTAGIRFL